MRLCAHRLLIPEWFGGAAAQRDERSGHALTAGGSLQSTRTTNFWLLRRAGRDAQLGLRMWELFPVFHELSGQAVPPGQRHQRLGPVVEVLAQHVVLRALGPVEGEVEEAARLHDPADVRQALVDDLD